MFGRKAPSHGAFVRSSPSPVYFTVATLMEKIVGPFSAGSLRLASTDVKVNPIVSSVVVTTISHYHGGCLVGKVVDRNLRLFGALRVVDGSTFTVSPGTNPQATLLMLGRCDSLASINAPVSQSDMFTFLLAGLPSEYESFVTTAKLQRPKPTMAELRSSLLLHESWLQQMHPITMLMILYTNRVRTRPRTPVRAALTHSFVVASLRSLRWSQALTRRIGTHNSSPGLGAYPFIIFIYKHPFIILLDSKGNQDIPSVISSLFQSIRIFNLFRFIIYPYYCRYFPETLQANASSVG
ncbi:unnamed protein product [Withania somnifera]